MASTWDMVTSLVAEPMAPEMTKNLVIIANGTNEFQKDYVAGNGDTIQISIPDPGVVTAGAAMDRNNTGNRSGKTSLTLIQKNIGIELTALDHALKVKNERDQIIIPRAQNLAQVYQRLAAEEIARKASNAIVMTADKEFRDMASGVNSILACEASGEFKAALNPMMNGAILQTGLKQFTPNGNEKLFKDGSIGRFNMCDWFVTPHIGNFTQVLPTLGSGTQLKAAITFTSGVATQAVFTVSGGTATLTGDFTAGTPFTISGVNVTDIYGNDTGVARVFYVKTTVTAAANTATVDLTTEVYTALPQKNVNVTANITATNASFLLTTAKTYRRGIIWVKQAFAVGEASLADYYSCENADIKDINGINLKFSRGSQIADGLNFMRCEALMGFKLLRDQFASTLFQEVV